MIKLGGSCLADADSMARSLELLEQLPTPAVAVVSALFGVTDRLLALADGGEPDGLFAQLHAQHAAVLEPLDATPREAALALLRASLAQLRRALPVRGAEARDEVLSFGERLCLHVLEARLRARGHRPHCLWGAAAGILTDESFGNAQILAPGPGGMHPRFAAGLHLVAGFVGQTQRGAITTLGRGGSDTTASFLAAQLGCPLILYKDVAGVRSADPRRISDPRPIARLQYRDALELAHYGLSSVQERALLPAMQAGIPVELRGLHGGPSTRIGSAPSSGFAISGVHAVEVLECVGPAPQVLRTLATLFARFAAEAVVPLLVSEGAGRSGSTIVLRAADGELLQIASSGSLVCTRRSDLGLVAVIGALPSDAQTPLAARISSALAGAGLRSVLLASTAAGHNLSILLERAEIEPALQVLHRELVEQE